MAKVKICGIRDELMVRSAAKAGAAWVGFNLVPKSPRYVGRSSDKPVSDRLRDLLAAASEENVRAVVLVADPEIAFLQALTEAVLPDAIQLHGSETPDFVASVRDIMPNGIEIWKAVGVERRGDLEAVSAFTAADRLLIDAKPPKDADRAGGHGNTFDWDILKGWHAPKPWLLAGGLTTENVAGAIAATDADAVDVSSGVERESGVKDSGLISTFIAAAEAA